VIIRYNNSSSHDVSYVLTGILAIRNPLRDRAVVLHSDKLLNSCCAPMS